MNSYLKLLTHKRVGLLSGTLICRLTSISRNLAKKNAKVCILEGMNSGWELAGREKICKMSGGPGTQEAEQESRGCSCREKGSSRPGPEP